MAKFSEIGRSERQSPGCVKPVAVLQAYKQAAARRKDSNEAEPGAKIDSDTKINKAGLPGAMAKSVLPLKT
jgi:hypothetical protein